MNHFKYFLKCFFRGLGALLLALLIIFLIIVIFFGPILVSIYFTNKNFLYLYSFQFIALIFAFGQEIQD